MNKSILSSGKNGFIEAEEGYTLMEVLVSISLVIMLMSVCVMFFNTIFKSPSLNLKGRAFLEARSQMEYCLKELPIHDTSYFSADKKIIIARKLTNDSSGTSVTITAALPDSGKELLNLKAYISR